MTKPLLLAWVFAVFLTLGVAPGEAPDTASTVRFDGTVFDASSGVPVAAASVVLRESRFGTQTARDGTFRVSGLPDSLWVQVVEFGHPCFHTVRTTISTRDLEFPFVIGLPPRVPRRPDGTIVPGSCRPYGHSR